MAYDIPARTFDQIDPIMREFEKATEDGASQELVVLLIGAILANLDATQSERAQLVFDAFECSKILSKKLSIGYAQ